MTNIGGNEWQVIIYPSETGGIFPSGTATLTIYVDCPPDNSDFPPNDPGVEDAIEIGDIIFIDPSGTITESCTNGPLEGATVTLYREFPEGSGNFVIPAPSDHIPTTNPQVTGSDGRYGWLTVAGTYKILVEKDGYNPEWSVEVTVPPPVNNLNVELDRTNGCDFGTLTAIPNPIPTPGSSTDLTLTMESSGLGNTVITAWVVYEPDEDICQVVLLPSPIPPGGSVTKTYPDDFTISVLDDSGTGNNTCDTDTIGAYTTEVQTEIGDPIIKTFYIAFNVLNEAVIGSVALVGASLAAIIAYAYRKKSI
ncbi:MAG: hypothetical protein KatS3mg003_1657 [Candidatus Nitrosocaldaceae archaeon]|nr:MAG: hypothetical protein KatS3mg003_1657 [Candidatus Nitrosocaldaceae archaeon]